MSAYSACCSPRKTGPGDALPHLKAATELKPTHARAAAGTVSVWRSHFLHLYHTAQSKKSAGKMRQTQTNRMVATTISQRGDGVVLLLNLNQNEKVTREECSSQYGDICRPFP